MHYSQPTASALPAPYDPADDPTQVPTAVTMQNSSSADKLADPGNFSDYNYVPPVSPSLYTGGFPDSWYDCQ